MLSRCIDVVTNQWFTFLIVEWYLWRDIPQFSYLLFSWWTFELCPVFFTIIKLLWTYEHMSLYVYIFLFLLGKYVRMRLLDGVVSIDSNLKETTKLFSNMRVTIYMPAGSVWEVRCPTFSSTLGVTTLWKCFPCNLLSMVSHCGFNLCFLYN